MSAEPATVQRWLKVLGDRGAAEDGRRVDAVHEFCRFYGAEPDELVASLFRQTEAGPRIRLKKRREVMARIDEFEEEAGGRTDGNHVRSFLIHNGVAMTAKPIW
jgi:hypothetical protein